MKDDVRREQSFQHRKLKAQEGTGARQQKQVEALTLA